MIANCRILSLSGNRHVGSHVSKKTQLLPALDPAIERKSEDLYLSFHRFSLTHTGVPKHVCWSWDPFIWLLVQFIEVKGFVCCMPGIVKILEPDEREREREMYICTLHAKHSYHGNKSLLELEIPCRLVSGLLTVL